MNVVHVGSRRDLKEFIELPYEKYAGHPVWVPPLRVDEWAQFNPKKNPALEHLEVDLFLARDDREVAGRVGTIINRGHDRALRQRHGVLRILRSPRSEDGGSAAEKGRRFGRKSIDGA